MYNFDKEFSRFGTDSVKWDIQGMDGDKKLMAFAIADTDFEVFPELKQAIVERAAFDTFGYTAPSKAYYDNYIKWCKERYSLEVKKEEMFSVPGVKTIMAFMLYALTKEGDGVMLTVPVYFPFYHIIDGSKRTLVSSKLIMKDGVHTFDFEDIENKFKKGDVKVFVLCNPHNPTGRAFTKEELERIVALCKKYNVYIFSDEIHCDFIYKGSTHTSIFNVEGAESLSVLAQAPSKTFNIPGLASSIAVIKNEEIRNKVKGLIDDWHLGVNMFGLKATEVCYGYGAQWVDEQLDYLYKNCELVDIFIKENMPKVKTYIPDATYLMWLDFTEYNLTQEELLQKFLNAGCSVNDGTIFGVEGRHFVRFNIGTQRAMVQKALEAIKCEFA